MSDAIKGERVTLCAFSQRYLTEEYVAWLNDPTVTQFSEQRHRRHSLDSCQEYFASIQASSDYFWAIVAHSPELGHIGNLSASVDAPNKVADLAIIIGDKTTWGLGFGLEAWNLAIRYLLTTGGMRRVTAGTMSINHGMLRIMEKSGMREEGRRKNQFLVDGTTFDLVMVAIDSADLID